MGLNLFRDVVILSEDQPVKSNLISTLWSMILKERNGELIDRSVMKAVVEMLVELNSGTEGSFPIYEDIFEIVLLEKSKSFYEQEAQIYLEQSNAIDYLKQVRYIYILEIFLNLFLWGFL